MKTRILIALLALLVTGAPLTPSASARDGSVNPETLEPDTAYFQGRGPGIKIQLRSRYHKIVFALITTTFHCSDSSGRQYSEALRTFIGNKGLLVPNVSWVAIGAVPINKQGRYKFRIHNSEKLLWIEDFVGHAGSKTISGQFRLQISQEDSDCHTEAPTSASQFLRFSAHRLKKR